MDKYEYKVRSEEISKLIDKERYADAVKIADTIDWRRVKSATMLLKIAALYRISRRNEDSREMLMLAYERYPTNRSVVYSLCELSIELDDVVAAIEYYKRFVKLAPRDNGVYTLRYRILEAQEASLEERIEILEELKKKDYQEEWAYELAYLYHRVGLSTKCAEECDDIILWFGDGPYVMKAMELKAKHVPLTDAQQQKYEIMLGNAGQNYSSADYESQGYDAGDDTSEGYPEEDYNAQGYTGQSYDGQDYTGQNYDSQDYTGQNYAGQGYADQNYDGQGYAEQNYAGQDYNETNYDAQQGYAAADYNGQYYENDYGEGYDHQEYADASYGDGYTDQAYAEGYDQQEYADQAYAGGYDRQGYADQSYDDGYQQENNPDQQYEADYSQQNYAGGNYAQNHMVDDGYGNLSYVDGAYQDSGYTSEFYVEQTYDENGNLMNSETYADDEYAQGSYDDPQGNVPGNLRSAEQTDAPKQYRNGLHLVENTTAPAGNSGDMSQYNTINLQKVVAESMKELFPDDNDDVFAEDREKYNSGEEIRSGIGDTRIFAGAVKSPDGSQTQTGRVNVAQMVTGVLEKAPEPHTGAIKKVLVPGEDARSIKSDSDIEELRDTTEKSVDDEHSRMEYNDENVYHEQSLMGANETDTTPSMTEPMKLDEVLVKWERMKQDNAKKHQEEIKKRVESQTGKIFADFDNSIKSGILGELEREEQEAQRQNQTGKVKKGTDGFLDADVTGDIPQQPASDDDFDVSYVTEQKPPKKGMKIEQADDVQEPGTTAEQDYAQIDESAQNDGSTQVIDDDESDAYTAKTDQETPGSEAYTADEPVNDTYSDNPESETELKTEIEIEIETEPATQEQEKTDTFTQKISVDAISQYDTETVPDTEESDTEASEGYTGERYADAPEGYTEEDYADAPEGYTGELYADAPEDDTGETYTDAPGEYTEEIYTDAPEEYTGEAYAEVSEEEAEETDFETSEEYREDADTSYADDDQEYSNEYADDSYTEDSYIEDSYTEDSYREDSYTEDSYAEDLYDDLEDAYSESPDESQHAARRQNYEYNERDLDPEDAESIAEMAKEDALKTQEIKMNTADLSSLSEKIVATTKKEASGAKREEIRDFTPEEQTLFENFAVTKKIKKQIVYALENMTLAPYTGNVIITGDAGLDTVRMAKNLVKEYQALDESFSGKLAKITGEKINQRNIKDVFEKLNNGGIIIEKANGMSEEKLYELATNLNQDTFGIVVIMEDTKKEITKLLEKQAMIVDYFNIRIDLMEMDNNALVAYAKNYALALEYSIDELGTLALYTRIANMQSGNHVVTKDEVRDIIDEAIWKSKKSKIKNFVDVLFARRYDNEDMIVLKERDFM